MHIAPIPAAHTRRRVWALLVLAALASAFAACSSGDRSLDAVDPQAVTANPTFDQVNAIIHNKCVNCHNSDAHENYSSFETCGDVVALSNDILDRILDNTMPPGALPRLDSQERLLVQRWVENGAPAPCN